MFAAQGVVGSASTKKDTTLSSVIIETSAADVPFQTTHPSMVSSNTVIDAKLAKS